MTLPKKVAIMQPYFFPYIGYWQLMNSVDCFVIYDNIEFTKKGWFHRNRFLQNSEPCLFSLPLKKGSDYLNVNQRFLADDFAKERVKLIRKIEAAYHKAPFFDSAFALWQDCLLYDNSNLFEFIYFSLTKIREYLGITTPIVISSGLSIDHALRSQEKVLAICKLLGASEYFNPGGGSDLYSAETFEKEKIGLKFQNPPNIAYPQFTGLHQPNLSILDVIMFNDVNSIKKMLGSASWFSAGGSE